MVFPAIQGICENSVIFNYNLELSIMSEKQQPTKKRKSFLKKGFSKLVAAAVNRISFVDIAEKIANSEQGTPFLERYKQLPEDWQNT